VNRSLDGYILRRACYDICGKGRRSAASHLRADRARGWTVDGNGNIVCISMIQQVVRNFPAEGLGAIASHSLLLLPR
jgi:hypothetical protein